MCQSGWESAGSPICSSLEGHPFLIGIILATVTPPHTSTTRGFFRPAFLCFWDRT